MRKILEGDSTACETRWCRLLDELLDQILASLPLPDIVSFGLVCKSWRSVMLARRSLCRPPPLLVTLEMRSKLKLWSPTPGFTEDEYEVSLSCLIVDKLHKLSMNCPVLVMGSLDVFHPCLGNSYGWLSVKKYGFGSPAYLLNPLSGERIKLPATSDPCDDITRVALSSPPTSGCCTVIAIMVSETNVKLASWRMRDGEWTIFAGNYENDSPFCMAFHKGELYVVLVEGVTKVYRLDGPRRPEFVGFVDDWVYEYHTDELEDFHLVGTEELFLVAMGVLMKFEVFKLDGRRWVKITDLGDNALFISRRHTHCYRTGEIMGSSLRANCIYYIYYLDRRQNLSVYSMEDGSIKDLSRHPRASLLLLMPNEWGLGGYIKIPTDIPAYMEGCRFLPKLNNEKPNERNKTYKERFTSIQNMVLIMFDHDTVLIPRETSWFGYYPDGVFSPVLPPQQTALYMEDWIGLKTLDEAGRVKYLSVPGKHLGISHGDMKEHIVPYLVDKLPANLNEEPSHVDRGGFISAWDAAASKAGSEDYVPLISPFRIEVDV